MRLLEVLRVRLEISSGATDANRQIAIAEAEGISAYDMLTEETRTRGTSSESDGNQMLYTYETLAVGAKLLVEVSLDTHTPAATRASLSHAISCWDGYIGGQGRQGRGRMAVIANDLPSAAAYLAHIVTEVLERRPHRRLNSADLLVRQYCMRMQAKPPSAIHLARVLPAGVFPDLPGPAQVHHPRSLAAGDFVRF